MSKQRLQEWASATSRGFEGQLPLLEAAPKRTDSVTCAWAHVDGVVPWSGPASIQLLSRGVGRDGQEHPGIPMISMPDSENILLSIQFYTH